MKIIQWIAKREYNHFDPLWFMWTALACHDHEWFIAIVVCAVGTLISSTIEVFAKYSQEGKQP